MSDGHGKSGIAEEAKLATFKREIAREVDGLLADPAQRWTKTSIADAGGMSRNQLYAWMGTGPQKLKKLPPAERIVRFYQGIGRPWDRLFRAIGWDPAGHGPPGTAGAGESELDRRIGLLRVALDRPGIDAEERRDLEIELVRLEAVKRTSEETISSVDEVLRRYGHGAA